MKGFTMRVVLVGLAVYALIFYVRTSDLGWANLSLSSLILAELIRKAP